MPDNPHEYTVRSQRELDVDFTEIAYFIQKYGVVEYYKNLPYVCLRVDGWKYWTMGASPEDTTIINRAET